MATCPGGVVPAITYKMLSENNILIAGAVGSGKSTFINAFIYTLATCRHYGNNENGAGLVLLDPKKVELKQWAQALPHVIYYADSSEKIIKGLNLIISEMQKRYKILQKKNLKKWQSYKIYVIIDELADLMINDKKAVLPLLQKILQLGRAAGIVLICGTQCPNRLVIPAALQANFTCRIGLKCMSAIESRQAVGIPGAELLPLYDFIYTSGCEKISGTIPLIEENKINNLINFYK